MKMAAELCIGYAIAGIIRYLAMHSEFQTVIADRIEVSTPLNSWKRVTEAAFIHDHGIDPFSTDMFHDTPLNLEIYKLLIKRYINILPVIFIVCDLLTATCLYKVAEKYMQIHKENQERNKATYSKNSQSLLLKDSDYNLIPTYVFSVYLFNPYIVFNCIGMTTTTFTNLFIAIGLYGLLKKSRVVCLLSLALATSQSLYPSILVVPLAIHISQNLQTRTQKIISITWTICSYLVVLFAVLFSSYLVSGNWIFLNNTFGFILTVSDLRPNIGTTWYFFTEMFEHFRALFLCALQINVSILYLVPLSLKFHNEPMLLAVAFTALAAMFRTYPSVGDVGFYLSLLPLWKHLYPFMQQRFIVCCVFIMTSVIAPVFWHLWIYSGAANANFYFGVTLAFTVAQIFVLTDLLFAYIKREYFLKNGCIDSDNKKYKLIFG